MPIFSFLNCLTALDIHKLRFCGQDRLCLWTDGRTVSELESRKNFNSGTTTAKQKTKQVSPKESLQFSLILDYMGELQTLELFLKDEGALRFVVLVVL